MPKVSIVLPVYNGEKYLRESLDSILTQTFSDWELIIVNDCSTDGTQNIIEEYVSKDSRIRTIKNSINQKLPESLNIGFRISTGEYLTWTSDDNMYRPEALEVMTNYLDREKDCYMVCTAMDIIDSLGNYVQRSCNYNYEQMLCNNCVGACFMYRRAILQDIGEYDINRFLVEDYDYWLKILFHYGKIDFIDRVLYSYRSHENSLSGKRLHDINIELLKLRKVYINEIFQGLAGRKDLLCQIYYEFAFQNSLDEKIKNKIINIVTEIKIVCECEMTGKVIVYGAGNYGKKAYMKYQDRIVYYADRNCNLVGQYINNVEIISLKKMLLLQKVYSIVIAAGPDKIYDFLTVLKLHGIKKCFIFQPEDGI